MICSLTISNNESRLESVILHQTDLVMECLEAKICIDNALPMTIISRPHTYPPPVRPSPRRRRHVIDRLEMVFATFSPSSMLYAAKTRWNVIKICQKKRRDTLLLSPYLQCTFLFTIRPFLCFTRWASLFETLYTYVFLYWKDNSTLTFWQIAIFGLDHERRLSF